MIFPTYGRASSHPPLFVLDVSVVAAWILPRRYTLYTHRVQSRLALGAVAVVTTNWPLDLADELRAAEVRGDITRRRVDTFLTGLAAYRIDLDERAPYLAWPEVLDLARIHNISVRDAASLELALRLNLPLATTDATLLRVAPAAGVLVFTP